MAERANTEGLLSENNYRLLDEIRRQRTSDKTKLSHGQPSTNFVKNLKTVVIFQKKHRFLIPPLAICWALPWALEKSR